MVLKSWGVGVEVLVDSGTEIQECWGRSTGWYIGSGTKIAEGLGGLY